MSQTGSIEPHQQPPGPSEARIDVVIAAWNRSETIERAVFSALQQPEVRKVFVIDDASTDDTAQRAAKADDGTGRLHIERLARNGGPSGARNRALELAAAPWVTILDGDDYLLPGRFSALLALSNDADIVADDLLQIGELALRSDIPKAMLSRAGFEPWMCDFSTFVLGNISRKGKDRKELGFFKPLIKLAFLKKFGLQYDEALRLGEDYALYARALAHGARFKVVPAKGYVSVVRANSLSAQHSQQDLAALRDSDVALGQLPELRRAERAAVFKHYKSLDAKVQWLETIEAVKARKPGRVLAVFFRSFDVTRYVVARLAEQAVLRTRRRRLTLINHRGSGKS